jgi:hypothetical protein
MELPQVAGGGDDLQIWKVAENNQSRATDNGLSSSLKVGHGTNNSSPEKKNNFIAKCQEGPRTWTDSLDKRPKLRKMHV